MTRTNSDVLNYAYDHKLPYYKVCGYMWTISESCQHVNVLTLEEAKAQGSWFAEHFDEVEILKIEYEKDREYPTERIQVKGYKK